MVGISAEAESIGRKLARIGTEVEGIGRLSGTDRRECREDLGSIAPDLSGRLKSTDPAFSKPLPHPRPRPGRPLKEASYTLILVIEETTEVKTVNVRLPDSVDLDDREAQTILAAQLYKQGRLSLGQAAEVAGLSKRAFAEILGRYEVSVFNEEAAEIDEDIRHA